MLHPRKWTFAITYQQQRPPKLTGTVRGQEKRWCTAEQTKKCSFLPSAHISPWYLVWAEHTHSERQPKVMTKH